MEEVINDYGKEIEKLYRIIEEKEKIIKKFIIKSNGLSVYVRSDIFGRSNLPRLDEQLWDLYSYQCEIEYGD